MGKRQQPVNVLHLLGTARSEGTGIARIVGALAKHLDPDLYRVHAWFLGGGGPLAAELRDAGAQVQVIDWRGGARNPAGAWQFWRMFGHEQFAIIHQHFGGRAPQFIARTATGAKKIVHLHDSVPVSKAGRGFRAWIESADLVIATSQATAECCGGSHPSVIYPGIDRPILTPSRQRSPGQVIGTAGRLVAMKGIEYLIRAVALMRDEFPAMRLEIAGDGPMRRELAREVQTGKLGNHIRFLGWRTDISELLQTWDIYVQPSVWEPFGIATLEAMASSRPVVASSTGGLQELVRNGETGWLVPPRDPFILAERLRLLLLNPDERKRMGAAGLHRAMEFFPVDRMVEGISFAYEEIQRSRGRR